MTRCVSAQLPGTASGAIYSRVPGFESNLEDSSAKSGQLRLWPPNASECCRGRDLFINMKHDHVIHVMSFLMLTVIYIYIYIYV